ncbi:MAG: hypothetical protein ABRQ39_18825 [Candidatus Eremiobacterota bacterium]
MGFIEPGPEKDPGFILFLMYFCHISHYVKDDWINTGIRDHKDNNAGKVGYEINFNRYFYKYVLPRPLAEIEADIKVIEKEIVEMLSRITS